MSTYIYCPRPSNGALELVKALGAHRLRRFDGQNFWDKKRRFKLTDGDVIVCWGATVPEMEGIRVLNSADNALNKKTEVTVLLQAGISCVKIADPVNGGNILGRKFNHMGGTDLLFPNGTPDYYVIKEQFINEYRLHVFAGRSIRAGIKVPREGFEFSTEADWRPNTNFYHPWIRSFDGGWRIKYDQFNSTAKLRKVASASIKALDLTFGAVDIGEVVGGGLKVLEVNRGPGIEGNTITTYARKITEWINKVQPEPEDEQ